MQIFLMLNLVVSATL